MLIRIVIEKIMSDSYCIVNDLWAMIIIVMRFDTIRISIIVSLNFFEYFDTYQRQFHMLVIRSKLRYMVHHIRYQQYRHGFEFEFQIHIVWNMRSMLRKLPIVS